MLVFFKDDFAFSRCRDAAEYWGFRIIFLRSKHQGCPNRDGDIGSLQALPPKQPPRTQSPTQGGSRASTPRQRAQTCVFALPFKMNARSPKAGSMKYRFWNEMGIPHDSKNNRLVLHHSYHLMCS